MKTGFTLLEIVVGLMLLGIVLGVALPPFRRLEDRMAVVAAREAAVGLFARARAEAPLRGGVDVVVGEQPPRILIEAGPDTVAFLDLGPEHRVALDIAGSQALARLPYDALGIGRVASRAVVFVKGDARATLVVSAYGRVSRR